MSAGLQRLAGECEVTPNTVIQAAWSVASRPFRAAVTNILFGTAAFRPAGRAEWGGVHGGTVC